jgi:hypothetical protein
LLEAGDLFFLIYNRGRALRAGFDGSFSRHPEIMLKKIILRFKVQHYPRRLAWIIYFPSINSLASNG